MPGTFEGVASADLVTLRDAIVANLANTASHLSYATPGLAVTRSSLKDQRDLLREVTQELTARSDQSGGVGLVEFGEAS